MVERDTPVIIPRFLASPLTLPPMPSLDWGTDDITREVLGHWKLEFPSATSPTKMLIRRTGVVCPIVAIRNIPAPVMMSPTSVTISAPILSAAYPLNGAATPMMSGDTVMRSPAVPALKPRTSCR